jgi:DNA topoisomerase IA
MNISRPFSIGNMLLNQGKNKRRGVIKPTQLGISLLMSYNDMEIDITRPTLRAQNEVDFTRIAKGEVDKRNVSACIQQCINKSYF